MLSNRVRTLPGRTAAHAWRTALFSSATVEGGHPCLGSSLTFDPKHAQLGSCLDSELTSPWPQHPIGPKRLPCHVLYGRTQSYVQTPASPMATFDSSGSGCTDAGSWLHPPRPYHSSPHGGLHPIPWLATISIIRLDAGINQPLPLPKAHPDPTVTVVKGEPGFFTEDTVSPLSEVPHSVPPALFTAASPVLQSEPWTSGWTPRPISGGQKTSPNGSNWHPSPKSADHLHSQTRSRDEAVHSDHSEQLTVFPWRGDFHRTSTLPLMWSASLSVESQNFAYLHTWDSPSILATSRWELPSADNLTIRCSFALANFVAWSPLKVQRNINSLYQNPTLHNSIKVVTARQTSLQVTTPELTFSFSWVSAVPRQYWLCLAIQFGYVMDRWNQQYFVPQLNIRPETTNTDQIHANAI